eukprot:SAG31_NODE_618_length_13513_cov_87.043164_7_plen_113_part_00
MVLRSSSALLILATSALGFATIASAQRAGQVPTRGSDKTIPDIGLGVKARGGVPPGRGGSGGKFHRGKPDVLKGEGNAWQRVVHEACTHLAAGLLAMPTNHDPAFGLQRHES